MSGILDESTRTDIVERICRISPDAKPQWGRMNVNGMICHVTDQFRVAFGEKEGKSDDAPLLGRTVLKWLVLYAMGIPKGVPTSPRVDQEKDGTPPTDFESDRKTLLEHIERFTNAPESFGWAPHFKFGPLSKKEWAILAAKHLDHHLKQFGA